MLKCWYAVDEEKMTEVECSILEWVIDAIC